jgi:acetyl esterase/lipase
LSLLQIFNALAPKETASHKVASGLPFGEKPRQRLDIYAPRALQGTLPVVFFIYGGSWSDGDRRNYDFAGRALAALGYVTVIADYRLLPEIEYPVFLDDSLLALQWLRRNISTYGGDPGRIALMGHSAGAYNAAMLALHPSYKAALDTSGGVRCVVGLSGPYDFFPFDGKITKRTFGWVPDPQNTQPVSHVTRSAPPMLLGTGSKDRLVYPRNTVALAKRLRQMHVAVTEIHYPELGHPQTLLALSRPGRRLGPVLADVGAFLAVHLASPVT